MDALVIRVVRCRVEDLVYAAIEFAVLQPKNQLRLRLAGFVVDGSPLARRRDCGRRLRAGLGGLCWDQKRAEEKIPV